MHHIRRRSAPTSRPKCSRFRAGGRSVRHRERRDGARARARRRRREHDVAAEHGQGAQIELRRRQLRRARLRAGQRRVTEGQGGRVRGLGEGTLRLFVVEMATQTTAAWKRSGRRARRELDVDSCAGRILVGAVSSLRIIVTSRSLVRILSRFAGRNEKSCSRASGRASRSSRRTS